MANPLRSLLERPERVVAGVMSGTSLDGIDVAIARLWGSGRELELSSLAFTHSPYPPALRDVLHRNVEVETSDVRALSQLNALLGRFFADAVARTDIKVEPIDEEWFKHLIRRSPTFGLHVMSVMAQRLRRHMRPSN